MSAPRTALDAGRRIVRYDLRRIASLTATVLAVAACADMPTAPATPTPAVPTPEPLAIAAEPSGPVFQGVFLGDAPSHRDQIRASIQSFGARVGKAPALVKTFFKVGDDYGANGWVGQVLREVSRAGSTNFVALDLRWAGAPATGLLSAITSGAADDVLRRAARGFADIGSPVLVELGWEMNGNWDYPWQGVYNGGA